MFGWFKSRGREENDSTNEELIRRIDDYVNEACNVGPGHYPDIKVKESSHGKALLESPAEEQISILYLSLKSYIKKQIDTMVSGGRRYTDTNFCQIQALQQLVMQLLSRKLPWQEQELASLFKLANDHWKVFGWYRPHNALLGILERSYKERELPNTIIKEVKKTINLAEGFWENSTEDRKLIERAKRLIGQGSKTSIKADFNWSKTMLKEVNACNDDCKLAWQRMLDHAQTADASKPTKKWLAAAQDHIDTIGRQNYTDTLNRWLTLIQQEKADNLPLKNDINATVVRGLIWAATLVPPESVDRDIKHMALYCFRKVKNVGAVSPKVGNACLYVLGQLPGLSSVSMLSELQQKIKYPSARRLVEKALDAAAQRNQMTRDDLVELSVPDFGLDANGQLRLAMDDVTALLSIGSEQTIELLWQKSDGKTQKTVPAQIKASHGQEIKTLKKQIKDMRTTLQAQVARIEKLFLKPRPWTYAQWRQRYLDHPLLLSISRKLIWRFENETTRLNAMLIDGQLQTHEGRAIEAELETDGANFTVRLWHPVHAALDEVLAWRNLISQEEITQPFKQAHREVYILTDAERATEQYSNRFAAHILKQHQLNALCQQRGWRYSLQGAFDSWNAPTLDLPQWDIAVEFYMDGVDSSENAMGIYNYVSSDQVRFIRNHDLLPLDQVEPIVFSEAMRDVDLFIGVCSIGNDPNWQDGGIHTGFNEYWREYAFGELLESAHTRKEVLAGLLPKLNIAKQCEIEGRFLKVQGKYRTYKIHLGSANILMEPNDQYLCIVESRSPNTADSRRLVLPFEGDHRMAVILSKAFLLAKDDKITDETILSQIKS